MDHLDNRSKQSATDGLHYWARIEGKSETMTEELLSTNDANDTTSVASHPAAKILCLVVYLALAFGLVVFCLRYHQEARFHYEPNLKGNYFEPKYLTGLLKPAP